MPNSFLRTALQSGNLSLCSEESEAPRSHASSCLISSEALSSKSSSTEFGSTFLESSSDFLTSTSDSTEVVQREVTYNRPEFVLVELLKIFLNVSVVRFPRYKERFESGDLSHFHEEGLGSSEADDWVLEHSIDEVECVSRFKNLRTRIALFLQVTDVDEKIKS